MVLILAESSEPINGESTLGLLSHDYAL